MTRETPIQQAILAALGRRADVRVARRNRGLAHDPASGRHVKFGDFEGGADITGILRGGRRLELEVKRPGQRMTKEQADFGAMMLAMGACWAVVHSVEEAVAVVDAALAERKEGA